MLTCCCNQSCEKDLDVLPLFVQVIKMRAENPGAGGIVFWNIFNILGDGNWIHFSHQSRFAGRQSVAGLSAVLCCSISVLKVTVATWFVLNDCCFF